MPDLADAPGALYCFSTCDLHEVRSLFSSLWGTSREEINPADRTILNQIHEEISLHLFNRLNKWSPSFLIGISSVFTARNAEEDPI